MELCGWDGPSLLSCLKHGGEGFMPPHPPVIGCELPAIGCVTLGEVALFGWEQFPDGASADSCQPQTLDLGDGHVYPEGEVWVAHHSILYAVFLSGMFICLLESYSCKCVIILEVYSFVMCLFCWWCFFSPQWFKLIGWSSCKVLPPFMCAVLSYMSASPNKITCNSSHYVSIIWHTVVGFMFSFSPFFLFW